MNPIFGIMANPYHCETNDQSFMPTQKIMYKTENESI